MISIMFVLIKLQIYKLCLESWKKTPRFKIIHKKLNKLDVFKPGNNKKKKKKQIILILKTQKTHY